MRTAPGQRGLAGSGARRPGGHGDAEVAEQRLDGGGEVRRLGGQRGGAHRRRQPGRDLGDRGRRPTGAGGLETSSTRSVAGSASRAASASSVASPPTASDRSRPPTPSTCETPTPAASSRQETCWAPVPLAATRPTGPGRTTLAKPNARPETIAVPQSGPMTRTPASCAARLSATSCSTGHAVGEDQHALAGGDGVGGLGDGVRPGHADDGQRRTVGGQRVQAGADGPRRARPGPRRCCAGARRGRPRPRRPRRTGRRRRRPGSRPAAARAWPVPRAPGPCPRPAPG